MDTSDGWARKTELVPALMVSAPVVVRMKGLVDEPMLPAALRARLLAVMAVAVRLVVIAPAVAVRVRLVPVRLMAEVMFMAPVVWVRERADEVMIAER